MRPPSAATQIAQTGSDVFEEEAAVLVDAAVALDRDEVVRVALGLVPDAHHGLDLVGAERADRVTRGSLPATAGACQTFVR